MLGIPEGVTQIVMLPVAWTIGTDFKPAARRPASEIVWFDSWGYTKQNLGAEPIQGPNQGTSLLEGMPGVSVEVDIGASPERVWEFASDINIAAQFSQEFQGAEWIDADGPKLGASFIGRNERTDVNRKWQTTSWIVACESPKVFAWNVNDRDDPSAQWRFELEKIPGGTRLRQSLVIGPRLSATGAAMVENPEKAAQILSGRQDMHRGNMTLTIQGIKRLAEAGG